MPYRYTEDDLADILKRQNAQLAEFQRNSGRGLPAATLKAMEKADGLKRDADGAPVPKKARTKSKAVKMPAPTEEEECVNLVEWAKVMRWSGRPIAEVSEAALEAWKRAGA